MIMVDYVFYKKEYCGMAIPDKKSFKQPLIKANSYLHQYMYREPDEPDMEVVKLCLCEVAELIYQDDAMR